MNQAARGWTGTNLLGRLRIGPKLLLAPALVLLLLVASSGGAWWALVRQNASLETIVSVRAARIRDATELVAEAQNAHARVYRLLTWIGAGFPQHRTDALAADIARRQQGIGQRFASLDAHTAAGSAERRFLAQARRAHADYLRAVAEVLELARADQSIGASAMQKSERAFETVALRLQALALLERQLSEAASAQAAADLRTAAALMPLLAALSAVLSLAVTLAVRRQLLHQVRGIGEAALDLASGNLTVAPRAYGNDEIADTARTLDASIRNLNGTLKGIVDAARSVDSATRQIAAGNASLTCRTGAQASSLEHTAASMQRLWATVSRTADTAQAANRLASSASSIAHQGGGAVGQLVQTLAGVRASSARVDALLEQAQSWSARSATLALNASVEAARAGEAGSAFAAVAGDMRAQAQQGGATLAEMRSLMAHAMAQIDLGQAAAEQAGFSLAGIASSVREVGDMIDRIGRASAAQASGISHVNTAIVQMDQMSQQNAALVAQAAVAAESLQLQAVILSRAVAGFKLDDVPLAAPLAPVPGKPHLRLASRRG